MKTTLIIVCTLLWSQTLLAQNLAQKHLSQLPPLPENICSISSADEDSYRSRILKVIEAIEVDVERIEQLQPTQNQMMQSLSKKTGISQQKLNKLSNSDNEAEGERLMQQKVLEQYGMSVEDIKKIENMSEAEQEQWAKTYAKTGKAKQKQAQDKKLYSNSEEISKLEKEFAVYTTSWSAMQLDFDKQERLAKAKLDTCLEKVRRNAPEPRYQGEHCINEKAIEEYLAKNEQPCYEAYCSHMTPKKKLLITKKEADLPKMIVLITQIQTLKNNLLNEQTGINLNATQTPEVAALALVKEFAKDMYDVFLPIANPYR